MKQISGAPVPRLIFDKYGPMDVSIHKRHILFFPTLLEVENGSLETIVNTCFDLTFHYVQ